MSESLLVTTNDGSVHYVRAKTADGGRLSVGGQLDGETGGRTIEDVVDLSVGARVADDIRAGADPSQLAEKLRAGREDVARTTDKFAALFGRGAGSLGKLANSIGQLFKEILARTQPQPKTDA